jgi:hypothetical protein
MWIRMGISGPLIWNSLQDWAHGEDLNNLALIREKRKKMDELHLVSINAGVVDIVDDECHVLCKIIENEEDYLLYDPQHYATFRIRRDVAKLLAGYIVRGTLNDPV